MDGQRLRTEAKRFREASLVLAADQSGVCVTENAVADSREDEGSGGRLADLGKKHQRSVPRYMT
jgi:hypothetical protein